MTTRLEIRSPRMRCHQCGSPELAAVCHHCGRGICDEHAQAPVRRNGVPVNAEFAGLGLDKAGPPRHCADCAHMTRRRLTKGVATGVLTVFGGVFLMLADIWLGLAAVLAGTAVVVACVLLDRERLEEATRRRPPLPVVPAVTSLSVRETVRGELWLDRDGTYRSSVRPVTGRLTVDMAVGRSDVERIDLYRRKFGLAETAPMYFCAGFVVLEGPVGLWFLNDPAPRSLLNLTYYLQGHPLFMPARTRGSGEWTLGLDYGLRSSNEVDSIPIWLTPSFVREQDQRALELELQWTELGSEDCDLTIDRIEQLRVLVPITWGNLETYSPDATVGVVNDPDDPNEAVRMIEFTRLSVDDHQESGRVRFSMRFENEIRSTDVIRGDFVVSFKGALSGVTKVSVFHPLGGRRPGSDAEDTVRTDVVANFRLCLDGIRYQDLRMVPDHNEEADRDRRESVVFEKVIPDHETVIDLTNELGLQGYYVKRVIENPPRIGASADVVNRIWDVAGRRYDGVYPVDFHLVLTGEEYHEGDIRAHSGNTVVQITAQGAYTRPVDSDGTESAGLEEKIISTWEHLREVTVTTLDRRAARATEAPWHRRTYPSAGEAATVPPRWSRDGRGTRVEWLRGQLDDAMTAMIRGDMTETSYESIRTTIQWELDKLHEE